jgi:hypothetical protein
VVARRRCLLPVVIVAAAALPACGGDDSAPAGTTQATAPTVAGGEQLKGEYTQGGRERHVDAQIAFGRVIDPYRAGVIAAAPDARFVGVQLKMLNRGRDPFPFEWARFQGYDERGRALPAGTQSTPLQKTMPGRPVRGQLLASIVAFTVPRGRRLAEIRMTSIVRLWQFRARWAIAR